MAILRTLQGIDPGQCFPLEGESVVLGRHPECDIVLEFGAISRRHARIVELDGNHYVEDLRSRNGTFVNGRLVTARRLLCDGDELGICDLVFVFQERPGDLDTADDGQSKAESHEYHKDRKATAMMVDDLDDLQQPVSSSTIMSKVDVSSGPSSLMLEANTAAKLRALLEIGRSLGKALGLDQVLPKLLDSLFTIFVQADRGFIVLKDRDTGRLIPRAVRYRQTDQSETIRISRTIVRSVMDAKEAILSADAASDTRFDMAESIVDFHIRSMMCAPLVGSDGDVLGVIQIDTLDRRNRFSREDLDVLAGVACQAAIAVENAELHEAVIHQQALARELALAHEVQQRLLPAAAPKIENYDFFEFYEPANELGGDYYDYIHLPDGRLAVAVADVSGKGISASLLAANLSAEARYCLAIESSGAAAMCRLNRAFCERGWEDRFVTMVVCVLDPARHEVTIVNAGHLPPLLRRRRAEVETICRSETRLPLGIDPNVEYPQLTLPLGPGDCITLYTDGITEAMNHADELYGYDRLRTRLAAAADHISAIGRGIIDDVKRFVGNRSQSDDMCLTCFGREEDE